MGAGPGAYDGPVDSHNSLERQLAALEQQESTTFRRDVEPPFPLEREEPRPREQQFQGFTMPHIDFPKITPLPSKAVSSAMPSKDTTEAAGGSFPPGRGKTQLPRPSDLRMFAYHQALLQARENRGRGGNIHTMVRPASQGENKGTMFGEIGERSPVGGGGGGGEPVPEYIQAAVEERPELQMSYRSGTNRVMIQGDPRLSAANGHDDTGGRRGPDVEDQQAAAKEAVAAQRTAGPDAAQRTFDFSPSARSAPDSWLMDRALSRMGGRSPIRLMTPQELLEKLEEQPNRQMGGAALTYRPPSEVRPPWEAHLRSPRSQRDINTSSRQPQLSPSSPILLNDLPVASLVNDRPARLFGYLRHPNVYRQYVFKAAAGRTVSLPPVRAAETFNNSGSPAGELRPPRHLQLSGIEVPMLSEKKGVTVLGGPRTRSVLTQDVNEVLDNNRPMCVTSSIIRSQQYWVAEKIQCHLAYHDVLRNSILLSVAVTKSVNKRSMIAGSRLHGVIVNLAFLQGAPQRRCESADAEGIVAAGDRCCPCGNRSAAQFPRVAEKYGGATAAATAAAGDESCRQSSGQSTG